MCHFIIEDPAIQPHTLIPRTMQPGSYVNTSMYVKPLIWAICSYCLNCYSSTLCHIIIIPCVFEQIPPHPFLIVRVYVCVPAYRYTAHKLHIRNFISHRWPLCCFGPRGSLSPPLSSSLCRRQSHHSPGSSSNSNIERERTFCCVQSLLLYYSN